MSIKIRNFNDNDAEKVSKLIENCFLNLKIGRHTKLGIKWQIDGNSKNSIIIKI